MDITSGDLIKYRFPEPGKRGLKEITGRIETVTEDYVLLLSDSNIRVKVSFKNFEYITPLNAKNKRKLKTSSN